MKNQSNTEMASARLLLIISALLSFTTLHVVYGGIVCEKLPAEICAFSVSSSGARCLLQKSMLKDGNPHYECQTSEIIVEITTNELTQTEECIKTCGVERMTVGMSAESLAESVFVEKLCSPRCYNKCPNIIDFYFNVAAVEGVYLPRLCEAHRSGDRRMISEDSLVPVVSEDSLVHVVTKECMKACGVERMTVGMSADQSLAESVFTEKLCSPRCYNKCPNIIDFYFNVAADKGVYLPRLCEAHRSGDRRMISENSLIPVKIPSVTIPSVTIPEIPIPPLPELPPVIPSIPIPEIPLPPLPELPPVIPSIPIPEIPLPPLPEIPVPVAIPP